MQHSKAHAMREHHGIPDQLINIENYSGNIDGCITSHKVTGNAVEYFNVRGQMVTKHFGNKWMLAEIARYHFTEALRTQDEPHYFQEWARNLHFAHYYEDFNPNWNSGDRGLLQVSASNNRLPHRPRSEDEDEESQRQIKRQKRIENADESITIIEELSTPAPGQYTVESDYELGPYRYDGVDTFEIRSDTDEEPKEDDEGLDDDNECKRLVAESEELMDIIDFKIQRLVDANSNVDYEADTEDF